VELLICLSELLIRFLAFWVLQPHPCVCVLIEHMPCLSHFVSSGVGPSEGPTTRSMRGEIIVYDNDLREDAVTYACFA